MTPLLSIVIQFAVLTWLCLLCASLIKARGWTPAGMKWALGNREHPPEPDALAGRADRTARNTLENLVLFATIALVAHAAGASSPRVLLGAQLFFWSRLLFIPVYLVGVPYVRTLVWGASIVGLGLMISGLG